MSVRVPARDAGSRERLVSAILRVVLVVAAVAAVGLIIQRSVNLDPEGVRLWLIGLGPLAPAVYVLLYSLQVIVAPVPGLPIGAAAGFAFGLGPAMGYGLTGLGLGVVVALLSGRTWGLRLLARLAGPEAIARWEQLRLINQPLVWLMIFLGPSPDLILFVAGMTRIPLRILIPLGIIGRAPAMATATLLGAGIGDSGPWLLIAATLVGILFGGLGVFFQRLIPQPVSASTNRDR